MLSITNERMGDKWIEEQKNKQPLQTAESLPINELSKQTFSSTSSENALSRQILNKRVTPSHTSPETILESECSSSDTEVPLEGMGLKRAYRFLVPTNNASEPHYHVTFYRNDEFSPKNDGDDGFYNCIISNNFFKKIRAEHYKPFSSSSSSTDGEVATQAKDGFSPPPGWERLKNFEPFTIQDPKTKENIKFRLYHTPDDYENVFHIDRGCDYVFYIEREKTKESKPWSSKEPKFWALVRNTNFQDESDEETQTTKRSKKRPADDMEGVKSEESVEGLKKGKSEKSTTSN